jgi:hypothetical protein
LCVVQIRTSCATQSEVEKQLETNEKIAEAFIDCGRVVLAIPATELAEGEPKVYGNAAVYLLDRGTDFR